MRRTLGAAAVALTLLVGATACGDNDTPAKADTASPSPSAEPTSFRVSGNIRVDGQGGWARGDSCYGIDGYDDMAAGAGVTIYDATGKAIAIGNLDEGTTVGDDCKFHFAVNDVPIQDGSDIYSVEISHRGRIQFTQAEAPTLSLTLG